MSSLEQSEEFVRLLTEHQSRLYAYILALLPDAAAANDVLQETNVVLWRKSAEFTPGTAFGAWAGRVAYFEVLAYRKRQTQDHHVFDTELLDEVADEAERMTETIGQQRLALRGCLKKLPRTDRELVSLRYEPGGSVQTIAKRRGKSVGSISQALYRIRLQLSQCIERAIARGANA